MGVETVSILRGEETLFSQVELAGTFWKRFKGLMFVKKLFFDGLLIFPCHSIHMFWMYFPLDLIFIDKQKQVVYVMQNIQPNAFSPGIRSAYYVLEVPSGTVSLLSIAIGDQLKFK